MKPIEVEIATLLSEEIQRECDENIKRYFARMEKFPSERAYKSSSSSFREGDWV